MADRRGKLTRPFTKSPNAIYVEATAAEQQSPPTRQSVIESRSDCV